MSNPHCGSLVAEVVDCGEEEVREAVTQVEHVKQERKETRSVTIEWYLLPGSDSFQVVAPDHGEGEGGGAEEGGRPPAPEQGGS